MTEFYERIENIKILKLVDVDKLIGDEGTRGELIWKKKI